MKKKSFIGWTNEEWNLVKGYSHILPPPIRTCKDIECEVKVKIRITIEEI